jgi:hypothetical protein
VPVQRYEWAPPGDRLHLDVKKLDRIGRVGHRITGDRRVRGIGWVNRPGFPGGSTS